MRRSSWNSDAVTVDLSTHTLTWTRNGVVQLTTPAAIGAAVSPTPPGTFFVTDVLASDPTGPYGAWIVALNGHSDALTEFAGADPRIAIHGTNDPTSIGRAASAGCVRLSPTPLAALASSLPLGTSVVIS
jgi:lipoprotein-anchoring transpeptidase ErfK/SrfK